MRKRILYSSIALAIIVLAMVGTTAYFSKKFTSDHNVVSAAKFDVDVVNDKGQTIDDNQFNLDGDLYPGMDTVEAFYFEIERNQTVLPVAYHIQLNPSGGLFPKDGTTPFIITMQKKMGENWIDVDLATTFKLKHDKEAFRILVDWPHGNNDIAFQGKTGNLKLEVITSQVDEVDDPDPEEPILYTGEMIYQANFNKEKLYTNNKEIEFYVDDQGKRVIEIFMGDEDGEFERTYGDMKLIENIHDHGLITYDIYDKSGKKALGSGLNTSVNGIFKLNLVGLGGSLSIESQELYDWIIK